MMTGNPEQDAQRFIEHQELITDELSECQNCYKWVDHNQISHKTDYLCDKCKKISFCICGEVLDNCLSCKPSKIGLFEKIRGYWIVLLSDLV